METSKNRYNGRRDAITKHGLKADDRLFRIYDNRIDAGLITPELLNQEEASDTLLTANDDTTVDILYVARRMEYQALEGISIYGFVNGDRARACGPILITVEQRGVQVGEKIANIPTFHVENFIPSDKIEKRVAKTKLIIRGAVK